MHSSKPKPTMAAQRAFTWRSVAVWLAPLLAFAWLAVAGRAASAGLVVPAPGALLGGGAVADRFVPFADYRLHFTTVSLGQDGRHVRFYGDWNGRCRDYDGAVTATFFKEVAVRADGSFQGRGPLESTSAQGSFRFQGRFMGAGSAAGTGSVKFTFYTASKKYSCNTGTVSWQARTALSRHGRPHPRAGRPYFGNTTQRLPMVLRVSRDGRSVGQQALMWNARCKHSVAGLGRSTSSPAMAIHADGTFGFAERYTETYGNFVARITSTHTGRFGFSTASGTWRLHVDVRNGKTNAHADTCDSGPIRWAVRI